MKNLEITVKIDGAEVKPDYAGEGVPEIVTPTLNSLYFDTQSAVLYEFSNDGTGVEWHEVTESYTSDQYYIESTMDPEEGIVIEKYHVINGKKQGNGLVLKGDSLSFIKEFTAESIENNEVVVDTTYGDSSGDGKDVETDLRISGKVLVDALKLDSGRSGIYSDGENVVIKGAPLSIPSGVIDGGVRYAHGTVVLTVPMNTTTVGYTDISAPGINTEMPVIACNGDLSACDFRVTGTSIVSAETIRIHHTNITAGSIYRINYGYWV